MPSFTAPAPSALIWLSPLPGATATSPVSPSSRAISGLRCPTICVQNTAYGMQLASGHEVCHPSAVLTPHCRQMLLCLQSLTHLAESALDLTMPQILQGP